MPLGKGKQKRNIKSLMKKNIFLASLVTSFKKYKSLKIQFRIEVMQLKQKYLTPAYQSPLT